MIIGDKSPARVASLYTRRLQTPDAGPHASPSLSRSRAEEDEIQISAEAMALQRTAGTSAQSEDVRWDRVAQLRAQIARGDYQVPVDQLVDRLAPDA